MERQARFTLRFADDRQRLEALLPANYHIELVVPYNRTSGEVHEIAIVRGEDRAGWTLDGYVLPRAASGLLFGEEIPIAEEKQ